MTPNSSKTPRNPRLSAEKAEHGTSVTTAFERIRTLIVEGKLSPGSWLLEADLCLHLNMSRTPVRGALYLLEREGYVVEHRGATKRRMAVAPLTREDAAELYPLIGRIEGLSGRRAATKPQAERTALADKLTAINLKLDEIARTHIPNGATIFDLDSEFHLLLINAGSGPRLKQLHAAIEPQTERYWRIYSGAITNDLHLSIEEHEAIVAMLRAGDAVGLEKAICANWENGLERLQGVMEVFGERGSW